MRLLTLIVLVVLATACGSTDDPATTDATPATSSASGPAAMPEPVGVPVVLELAAVVRRVGGSVEVSGTVTNPGGTDAWVAAGPFGVVDGALLRPFVVTDVGEEAPAVTEVLAVPAGATVELESETVDADELPDGDVEVCVEAAPSDVTRDPGEQGRITVPVAPTRVCTTTAVTG